MPLATLSFAVAGAGSGLAGRWLLARLRRGAIVHSGSVAGAVALLWAVLGWRVSSGQLPPWWLPIPLVLTWFAVLLTATDLRHRRLPDALTLPAYPALAATTALAAALGGGWSLPIGAAVGAVVFGTVHALVRLASPASLGAGDVKLSGSLGAVLGAIGWPAIVLAAGLAALLTLTLGLLTRHRGSGIPHGPGLLAATCVLAVFPGSSVAPP
ncbi:MAG: prepilin peptidase [Actinophytocola sp.]|uniref:prepilin peptidase n=1 Tax=Actinophytocola sp. TaxID=1872138 RepID=UPI0013264621|nr:A24 family peptidase [Actinophytocola sp.]MPZ82258.1 prepilin peptidase [Actinophytocola sp.]